MEKSSKSSLAYTVAIINYGQDDLVSGCLSSIHRQSVRPTNIFVVDNSGHLRAETLATEGVFLLNNRRNLGYSGGCNLALNLCHTEYLLVMNPDVLLEPDYAEHLLAYMDRQREVAALSGLLLRYDFDNDRRTNIIDSAGIEGTRTGRFSDRGQGIEWKNQYLSAPVFGVSGAAAFFRTAALQTVAVDGEVFDEDMLAYKEDIDIAWRLNSVGWVCMIVVEAIAYHGRAAGGSVVGWRGRRVERLQHSLIARRLAFKNQFLLLLKNGNRRDLDCFRTLLRQLIIVVYICVFEPTVLGIVPKLIRQIPKALTKRMWNKRMLKKQFKVNE